MAKILIAGCGDIGTRLAELLIKNNHHVVGIKRSKPVKNKIPFEIYQADLTQSSDLSDLNNDFDFIFFMPTPDQYQTKAYEKTYLNGLQNLTHHFSASQKIPTWFFISSTSVYGQQTGEWVDEQSFTEPENFNGKILLQAEQHLMQNTIQHVMIRFSGIYGPGRNRLINQLPTLEAITNEPPVYTNRIHQDDCASVLAFLLDKKLAGIDLDDYYLASDDDPATQWEVYQWLRQRLGFAPLKQLTNNAALKQNKRCRNQKIKALGYRFLYPSYKTGYAEMIDQKLTDS